MAAIQEAILKQFNSGVLNMYHHPGYEFHRENLPREEGREKLKTMQAKMAMQRGLQAWTMRQQPQ